MLHPFRRFQLHLAIVRRAGSLYKTYLTTQQLKKDVSAPDLFLTAIAEYYQCPILTRNVKHFTLFNSIITVIPY